MRVADRRERVIFDATDNLSPAMIRMAASAKVLDKSLDGTGRSATSMGRDMDGSAKDTDRAAASIDRFSGRLGLLLSGLTAVGPALIPLGAGSVQVITGLASQFGFAAAGAGAALLAFQGVGEALKAVNAAALEPSSANLTKAQLAMEQISPAARDLVNQLHDLTPQFHMLRDAAASNFFPGVADGLDQLATAAPRAAEVLSVISATMGDLTKDTAESLTSGRWTEFANFIEAEAPTALNDLAAATGNTAHAVAGMWMAFTPANNQFSRGLVDATARLDAWAAGLSSNESFQGFIEYLQENGPAAASAIGSINDMLVSLTAATAPLGGPTLRVIAAFADVIAAIADSPLGTPLIAMTQLAAVTKLTTAAYVKAAGAVTRFNASAAGSRSALPAMNAGLKNAGRNVGILAAGFGTAGARTERESARMRAAGRGLVTTFGKAGAAAAGMAVAMSPLPEKLGLSNTAMFSMAGMMAGPWGVAVGAGVGLVTDLASANDNLASAAKSARAAMNGTAKEQEDALAKFRQGLKDAQNPDDFMGKAAKQLRELGPLGGVAGAYLNKQFGDSLGDGAALEAKVRKTQAALAALRPELTATFGYDVAATATRSVTEFNNAVLRANEILSGRAGMRDFEAAIDAASESIKKNGRNLDINTQKGRDNQAALDQIAASALKVTENMSAANRAPVLARARNQIIAAGRAMGMTRKAAADLAAKLLQLNGANAKPSIKLAGGQAAIAGVNALQVKINALHGKQIDVVTRFASVGARAGLARADGGAVFGPGGPRDDLIPARLSNGEHVLTAAEVQAAGGQGAIYRMRAAIRSGNAPRFADGGAVLEDWLDAGIEDLEYFANGGAVKRRGGKRRGRRGRGDGKGGALARLEAAADAAKDALEAETRARDNVTSSWDSLNDSVKNTLTSPLFSERGEGWAWMSTADRNGRMTGDVFSKLQFDIGQAQQWSALSASLGSRGVSGAALQALFEQGGVQGLQAMSGLDNAALAKYQALFDQRAALVGSAGAGSATQVYGAELDRLNAHVATLTAASAAADKRVDAAKTAARNAKKKAKKTTATSATAAVAAQMAGGAKAAKGRAKHKRK